MSTNNEIKIDVLSQTIMVQLAKLVDELNHITSAKLSSKKVPLLSEGIIVLLNGASTAEKKEVLKVVTQLTDIKIKKVDAAKIFSEYIGETEKNISSLLNKAIKANVILFFDEADALFGKKTNVQVSHDKYANQEVSYLLERLSGYQGMVIFATIKKVKPLSAIKKRFHSILEF